MHVGELEVPIGGLVNASDPSDFETAPELLAVEGEVPRGFTVVDDALLYWTVVVIANGNFLRVEDDGRQGKSDRNEMATEFQ